MDKAERKARSRAWRDSERDAAKARLPLGHIEMKTLFETLEQRLRDGGCDHSRRFTDRWLAEHGHSAEGVHRWLDKNGGFCDCEALANAEEAWRAVSGRG